MSEEKIQQLNIIENNLSQVSSQKQQYQKQTMEIDSAITEIKDKKEAYQIVGSLMVKKDSKDIKKDLNERKEIYSVRLESLEKQESKLKEQAKSLREELVNNLEKK
jgi:prefoldin beta subunit